ncbi:hypothetical protein N0V85_007406 [Neurospora sp. IMI 360204]|nr:hypothetical protein N0V85_007406 [Neurospora sp. IMI 360204]
MKSFLDLLPIETVDNIVKYLPTRDANSFAQTCWATYWRADPHVWKDNVPTSTKLGPITWGVVTKQLKVVKKAVEAGADINAPDWLPCFHIPERCDKDPDEWSLAKAASKDANGSPLHFAALTNNLEAAEYLLQKDQTNYWADENEDQADGKYYDYLTLPLHTAVCHNSLEVAKLFLQHGASFHLHGIDRDSAEAAEERNLPIESDRDILHELVWKGPDYLASIDLIVQLPDTDINAEDDSWATPLQIALSRPHNAVVIAKLAEFGAMEMTCDKYSQHWLHECIRYGMYDNALALLKGGLDAPGSRVGRVIRSDAALIFTKAVAFKARLEEHHIKQIKQTIRMLVQDYGLELNALLFDRSTNKEEEEEEDSEEEEEKEQVTPLEYLVGSNWPMAEHLIQLLVDLGARLDIRNGEGHISLVYCLWVEQLTTEPTLIRPQTIRALIESCGWANIRLDEKYTWGREELTLGRILEIRFPGWKPREGWNNRALWKDLVRHLSDRGTTND